MTKHECRLTTGARNPHSNICTTANACLSFVLRGLCFVILLCFFTSASPAAEKATNEWSLWIDDIADSSPALAPDGTIYFGAWNHAFWAVNPDGTRKWVFRTLNEVKSSPAVAADGTIYFGCRDRRLYALSPDGKKRWEFLTGAWVDSSPAIGKDGTIYFGSWDKSLYALKTDCTQRWKFDTEGVIDSSPAVDAAGNIYFGSHDRKFYALDPEGHKQWTFGTGGSILSSPALDHNGLVYFTSTDGYFYALTTEGKLRWKLQTGGITDSSPVIGTDDVLFVGVNEELWAISPEGNKLWARWLEDQVFCSPVAFANRSVCCSSEHGSLINLSSDQQFNWEAYPYGYGHNSAAVNPKGLIYVAGDRRYMAAIKAYVPLAPSSWPKFRANPRNTGNLADSP